MDFMNRSVKYNQENVNSKPDRPDPGLEDDLNETEAGRMAGKITFYSFIILIPSLLMPLLDDRLILGLFAPIILLYSIYAGDKIKIKISNVNIHTSIFNSSLLSLIFILTVPAGIPKYVIGASMFLLLGHEFRKNAPINILIFTFLGFIYFIYYFSLSNEVIQSEFLLFLSLIGGITASLVESIEVESDKRVTLLLSTATVFLIFSIYGFKAPVNHLLFAFTVSFFLSLGAMKAGVADESGLMSATLIGTLIILFTDIRFFIVLVSFYILGSAATKYKYSIKKEMGIEEPVGGARGYANVFANSLPALFFAMNYGVYRADIFLVSFVASIATALGDTMASEIGKAARRVYLITNFKPVKAGESGGVSLQGEIAAATGSALVVITAYLLSVIPPNLAIIAFISGFVAVHVDSVLGATLEKMGYLTNSGVNFIATLSTIVFCYFLLL
jgi:uncharacterized protein (TIGR00297 family)